MPNTLAYLMLAAWPAVTIILFRRLSAPVALLLTIVVGFLFLPPLPAKFDFPLLPPFHKHSIPALSAFLIAALLYGIRGPLLPDSRLGKVLMLTFILSPFATVLSNGEGVTWGPLRLPGLGFTDAIALPITQFLIFIPFVMARQYLVEAKAQRMMLFVLLFGGLAYSVPMLAEVRLAPQLNIWIYGYFQHDFAQTIRFGGFRPTVFLYHGIWVAFFCMMTVVAAAALFKFETRRRLWYALAALYLGTVLILAKSLGALILGAFLLPVVLLFGVRMQLRVAALMALLAIGYPMLKAVDMIPTDTLLSAAETIDEQRANSLEFRFRNEDQLLERAYDKPVFGWGSWGRNLVYNRITGSLETISDGRWIIVLGQFGWIGFLAEFGLIVLPIFLLWREAKSRKPEDISPYIGPLTLLLAANAVEMVPNATLTPLTWLLSGTLLGYAETLRRERLRLEAQETAQGRARYPLRWRPMMD